MAKRVLCIDDNQDTCEMMTVLIGRGGYDVVTASNVTGGFTLARKGGFDLIIIDWMFTDGTGIELCQMIRTFDPKIPILFYSGVAYKEDLEMAMKVGAQGYLVKPTGLTHLLQVVSRHTGSEPGTDKQAN